MVIRRYNLRDQVRDQLEDWLADGRLKSGQKLEEVRLSRALGVSRTPLREALSGLAVDGLIESVPHKGFRVPELSVGTVRDLYPIVGGLEGLAVRMSGAAIRELAAPLAELNAQLETPHLSGRQRWELDRRWHQTLVGKNPNVELGTQLQRLHRRIRPYEGLWSRPAADQAALRSEHAAIAAMLAEGRAEAAAEALLEHWVRAVRPASHALATPG